MISIYNQLTYDEDERIKNPFLYYGEKLLVGHGNRKCEHATITNKKLIEKILNIREISYLLEKGNDRLSLSVLWNLPRKQYNETTQWVCMSGYIYDSKQKPFTAQNFVISNNIVNDDDQQMAMQIINLVNRS